MSQLSQLHSDNSNEALTNDDDDIEINRHDYLIKFNIEIFSVNIRNFVFLSNNCF